MGDKIYAYMVRCSNCCDGHWTSKCPWMDYHSCWTSLPIHYLWLPPSTEVRQNRFRIVTDCMYNEVDKKIKIVRTYKIEERFVSKFSLQNRWPKFGEYVNDKRRPDPMAATIVAGRKVAKDKKGGPVVGGPSAGGITAKPTGSKYTPQNKRKGAAKHSDNVNMVTAMGDRTNKMVKCRDCDGDHYTSKCPWKDAVLAGRKIAKDKKGGPSSGGDTAKSTGSKCIPQSKRKGANKRSDNPNMPHQDDATRIFIANLSYWMTETELEDLVRPFGPLKKRFLAKDKKTGYCKGYAYIHFKFRNDAAKAIAYLNGYGYDYLILIAGYPKPPGSKYQYY